jgi:probable HAF family extracellular repeat protein
LKGGEVAFLKNTTGAMEAKEAQARAKRAEEESRMSRVQHRVTHMHHLAIVALILALIGMLALRVPQASAQRQGVPQIFDLGVLGGPASQATGVNEHGDVVGASTTNTGEVHAFLLPAKAPSGMTDLGVLGRINGTGFSAAASIDNEGVVTGTSTTSDSLHAFRWTLKEGMLALGFVAEFVSPQGSLGLSVAAAISHGGGKIVGTSTTTDSLHAFLWTPEEGMRDLGTLGGAISTARGVNSHGQVVGASITTTGAIHAFLWTRNNGMQDLGTLGGATSIATGINERGQVVGASTTQAEELHAFVWTAQGGMEDIGTLGGPIGMANAISNDGLVVGISATTSEFHAFVWTAKTGIQDLGALATPSGVGLSEAFAIGGDHHTIVGVGTTPTGEIHALLWTFDSSEVRPFPQHRPEEGTANLLVPHVRLQ